jgi:hypothetical protein
MLNFISFLFENEGNRHNEMMGRVYERQTALNLHDSTAAAENKDPEYTAKISAMRAQHEEDKKHLPANVLKTALERAKRSSDAYLKTLESEGISHRDINKVHHTSKGIDHLVGHNVERSQNPHDVVVETKSKQLHGASLKATSGTLSNNGLGVISAHGQDTGIANNVGAIWKKGIKKAGHEGKSIKEIKEKRKDPAVKSIYKDTQLESAKHHVDSFNEASHDDKLKHMRMLMKLNYEKKVPYAYVNGETGKSTSIDHLDHVNRLNNAKSLYAVQKGYRVMIHDHTGTPILDIEHRSTHGPFANNQINARLARISKKTTTTAPATSVKGAM